MRLHVLSFNIPYPPNYGGIIDVYYKIKALHALGVQIVLHCYEYERPHASELEALCHKVYYYKRQTGLLPNLTVLPYNVYSRRSKALLRNLLMDDSPILFEGLHSCYHLGHPALKDRFKVFRECNIEHDYYRHLALAETNLVRKAFFQVEAWRFHAYQRQLRHADWMIGVSTADTDYLRKVYPTKEIDFVPCFHANDKVCTLPGSSDYVLYHAKLSVMENERAALYLMEHVFPHLPYRCVVAGMDPSRKLRAAATLSPNIELRANPSEEEMRRLQSEAHVNMLITFQDTGLKLKLLNSLFAGRHVLVNAPMTVGSGLGSLCHIADSPEELIAQTHALMRQPMDEETIGERESLLFPLFSNSEQARRIVNKLNRQERKQC